MSHVALSILSEVTQSAQVTGVHSKGTKCNSIYSYRLILFLYYQSLWIKFLYMFLNMAYCMYLQPQPGYTLFFYWNNWFHSLFCCGFCLFVLFLCSDAPVITSFLLLVVLIILPPSCCGAADALLIELVFSMKGWNVTSSVCRVVTDFDHKLSHIEKKKMRIAYQRVWSVFFLCLFAFCSFVGYFWRFLPELGCFYLLKWMLAATGQTEVFSKSPK